MAELRSEAAVFRTDENHLIRDWTPECERLTGISADEATERPCWEVIRGQDPAGGIVCHRGCSIARLAGQGWPADCIDLEMRTRFGTKRITISTIVLKDDDETTMLHLLREAEETTAHQPSNGREPCLTRRQREILHFLVEGVRVKEIATRLTLSETTIRNHVHAILRELDAHSQLEAVAKARELCLPLEAEMSTSRRRIRR
jgi:DNA-binding CsgD family transcriptional regulator